MSDRWPCARYALFIIVGIVVAIVWGDRRWVARGGEKGTVLDIAIWAVPFGLIGGRLYQRDDRFGRRTSGKGGDPVDALKVWQGRPRHLGRRGARRCPARGSGVVAAASRCSALGDAVAPAILLAQAIGRLGNYFNQELYGRETDVPWGTRDLRAPQRRGAGVAAS
ncbi:hypothetical protein FXW78_52435 [Rhodococcus opacus]|nr:hypothetical protein [Rhodococcus opacus]